MLSNIFLLLLVSFPFNSNGYKLISPEFYGDFLEHISAPKRIVGYVCVPERISVIYQKHVSNKNLHIALCNTNRHFMNHLVHMDKIVTVINMTCEHSGNILIQIFVVKQNDFDIEAYKIYKITEFSKNFTLKLIYKWSIAEKRAVYKRSASINKLTNLMGEPIRVSYAFLLNESIQHLSDYRNILDDQNARIIYRLMSEICLLFNATHVPIIRSYWGEYVNSTGDYTEGMFYDLCHDLADVAGNAATMSQQRLQHFKFLPSTGNINLNVLKWYFRAPPLSYTQNIWMLVFQKALWFVLLALGIIFYILIAIVANFEDYVLKPRKIKNETGWYMSFDVVITTATQRGSSITFSTFSGKILCYCLYVLSLLIFAAYSAHFLVLLQSSSNEKMDFNKILENGMELGCDNYSYNTYYFLNPNDRVDEKVRRKIYDSKILGKEHKFFLSTADGMQAVKNGKFAFHAASTFGFYEMAKVFDEATLRSIRSVDSFINLKMHIAVPKNSSLDDFLAAGFLYLKEAGIMKREMTHFFPQQPIPDFTKPIYTSLDLRDTYFVFLVLVIGMILSIIIFLFERALH